MTEGSAASSCWAASLGGCSSKLSREHLVSRSFFTSKHVRVQGLPWCKDAPKEILLNDAVSKILCSNHNNTSTILDECIADYADAIRSHIRLSTERSTSGGARKIHRLEVRARLLERWLLKTMINLGTTSPYAVGPGGTMPGRPTPQMVDIVFGKDRFRHRAGMYVAAQDNMQLNMDGSFSFAPVIAHSQHVVGGLYTVFGINFYLCLTEEGPGPQLPAIQPAAVSMWSTLRELTQSDLKRLKKIHAKVNQQPSHEIKFVWSY